MPENHMLFVRSKTPPTVEIDFESRAAYVRFKKAKVVRTIARQTHGGMHVAVDLDAKDEVIGVESIGFTDFSLHKIVREARVDTSNVDLSRAVIRPTPTLVAA